MATSEPRRRHPRIDGDERGSSEDEDEHDDDDRDDTRRRRRRGLYSGFAATVAATGRGVCARTLVCTRTCVLLRETDNLSLPPSLSVCLSVSHARSYTRELRVCVCRVACTKRSAGRETPYEMVRTKINTIPRE